MIIRPVKREDLDKLIWEKSLEEYKSNIEKSLKESLNGECLYLVAEINGEIVGQIKSDLPEKNKVPYMSALRVPEEFRNQKIGTGLIEFLEKELKQRGYKKVSISVAFDNPNAKRLYERLGYKVKGDRLDKWTYTKNGEIKSFQEEVYDLEMILK